MRLQFVNFLSRLYYLQLLITLSLEVDHEDSPPFLLPCCTGSALSPGVSQAFWCSSQLSTP